MSRITYLYKLHPYLSKLDVTDILLMYYSLISLVRFVAAAFDGKHLWHLPEPDDVPGPR